VGFAIVDRNHLNKVGVLN